MTVFYTTFADEDEAVAIVQYLLEHELLACANMIDIRSMYRWEGEIIDDDEMLVICKTPDASADQCMDVIEERHPYDVPVIVELEVDMNDAYQAWMQDVTGV